MPSGCHSAMALRRPMPPDLLLQEVTSGKRNYNYLQGGRDVLLVVSLTDEARPQHERISSAEYGSQSECFGGTRMAGRAHVAERLIQRHDGWKSPSSKNCHRSDTCTQEDTSSGFQAVLQQTYHPPALCFSCRGLAASHFYDSPSLVYCPFPYLSIRFDRTTKSTGKETVVEERTSRPWESISRTP